MAEQKPWDANTLHGQLRTLGMALGDLYRAIVKALYLEEIGHFLLSPFGEEE